MVKYECIQSLLVCWILEGDVEFLLYLGVHDYFLRWEQWFRISYWRGQTEVRGIRIVFYIQPAGGIVVHDVVYGTRVWFLYAMFDALAHVIYMTPERRRLSSSCKL